MHPYIPGMKIRWRGWMILLLLLAACEPKAAIKGSTSTPLKPVQSPAATLSGQLLFAIIEVSDPQSSTYDPQSASYTEFPAAVKQLAAIDPAATDVDIAGELAYASAFPRQDAYLAAQALMSLGVDGSVTTLPILIDHLKNQKSTTLLYSAYVLSFIGKQAACAVGNISPLLWDVDPTVRSMAALALQNITGEDLVPNSVEITPGSLAAPIIAADTPEGKIVAAARTWWAEHGSKINWHPSYGLCDP